METADNPQHHRSGWLLLTQITLWMLVFPVALILLLKWLAGF